jgi:putative acetyltransferase
VTEVLYRTFRPGDEAAFCRLNEAWIGQDFSIEPADREVLDDPRTHILAPGGHVCFAEEEGRVVGCCALVVLAPGEFELAWMTVAEDARSRGIGRRLLAFVIGVARQVGAQRVCLELNNRAAAAVRLCEQAGFRRLPAPSHPSKHARAGIFMELRLKK